MSIQLDLIAFILFFWMIIYSKDFSHVVLNSIALFFCMCFGLIIIAKFSIKAFLLRKKIKKLIRVLLRKEQ